MSNASEDVLRDAVVLWGPSAAGKSGFVGGLYALGQSPSGGPRWVFPLSSNVENNFVQDSWLALLHGNVPKTQYGDPDRSPKPQTAILTRRSRAGEEARLTLALVDPPGEDATEEERRDLPAVRALRAAISKARAVIWFVPANPQPGAREEEDRMWILHNLTGILQEGGCEMLPEVSLAVCLSKIDELPAAEFQEAKRDPYAALSKRLGERTLRWLEAVFPRMETFAISAVGEPPAVLDGHLRAGGAAPSGRKTGAVVPARQVAPINLDAVVDWIYENSRHLDRPAEMGPGLHERVRTTAMGVAGEWPKRRVVRVGTAVLFVVAAVTGLSVWLSDGLRVEPRSPLGVAPAGSVNGSNPRTFPRKPTSPARIQEINKTLANARRSARERDWRAALNALGDTLPSELAESQAWDSIAATAALHLAEQRRPGGGRDLYMLATIRASRVIDAAEPASHSVLPLRLVRARACIEGRLTCDEAQVLEDLNLGSTTATNRDLRARFQELRARWGGRGGTP